MRFANLIHNGLSKTEEKRVINLGDAFEIIAINRIYEKMGIEQSQIKYIDLYELETYRGEKVILPINFMLMPRMFGVDMLNMSSDIIPVFLGVTFAKIDLNERQIDFLKKWQPIGCRDEYTKEYLTKLGVSAYLSGCIVTTIESREDFQTRNKVVFIDAPKGIEKWIPENIKKSIIFMDHEYVVSSEEVSQDSSYRRKAEERIDFYDKNACLIVTSRFHGAVIALALGIPVILVAENNFYKFSWLSKLLPFYDNHSFDKINWEPRAVDVVELKTLMTKNAIDRLSHAWNYHNMTEKLEKILRNDLRDDSPALRYVNSAIDYITKTWQYEEEIEYGIWGINDNAECLYEYILKNFKNKKLTKVYDGLRETTFHGRTSEFPSEHNVPNEMFLFVTSNTAHKVALELMNKLKKTNYYLCKLEFMKAEDL